VKMDAEIAKIPKLSDLYELGPAEKAFKQDTFNWLMNQQPSQKWIKVNEFAGKSAYIPIGIIETLLQKILKEFRIEIIREGVMFNAVYVTVRLHYISPVTDQWTYHDGTGAQELQTKKGASPADLSAINKGAVQMSLPAAKSYAIKDAAEHLGALFGRDLNRKEVIGYKPDLDLSARFGNNNDKVK